MCIYGEVVLCICLKSVLTQRNTVVCMKHRLKPPGNECRKLISVMKHSSDESVVKDNIKAALQYRQSLGL